MQTAVPSAPSPALPSSRQGLLALSLQEAFTVTARLRGNRQVATDAESFRARVKQLLAAADQEARREGYSPDTVRKAVYAFVAFLDESVLNSAQPMFSAWSRRPLQEEVFGDHLAGENFFRNLRELLAAPDSGELADLLEVHQLCMLLGFQGRYAVGDRGELSALMGSVGERIRRIRGGLGPLSPEGGLPPGEVAPPSRDRWLGRLGITALVLAGLALVLFVVFRLLLASGAGGVTA